MKDISNEQIFLLAVESGSFKAAAEILGMDPSLVSRRIANLERRLNLKLFERSTKNSYPSEQGHRYYKGLKNLFEQQQVLESEVQGSVNTPSGHLKVAAAHDFGVEFISEVLQDMVKQFDGLTVELSLGSQFENLHNEGIDVAVRIGELPDSSLIARRIGNVSRILVASPDYIQTRGMPQSLDDLAHHDFIFYLKSHMDAPLQFTNRSLHVKGKFVVNSVTAIKRLVLAGAGLHLGPRWAFKTELLNGELVEVLPEENYKSFPLHAVYVSRSYVPAKVRVFIDLLIQKYGNESFV